jgi:radical SAM protein with 4Fe4S-binding SPASM domain
MENKSINLPVIIQITNVMNSFVNRNFVKIAGKPVFGFLVDRLEKEFGGEIIVATTDLSEDDLLVEAAYNFNLKVYRGDLHDLPLRLLNAANLASADSFINVYGNHPLIDISRMKELASVHINGDYEFSYNGHLYGDLWGTDCEVFSKNCLQKVIAMDISPVKKDHFSYIIRQMPKYFKIKTMNNKDKIKRKFYKLYLETLKDLELISDLVTHVNPLNNDTIVSYLADHPLLASINLDVPSKEVGLDKLYLHPYKLTEYFSSKKIDLSFPISVELSLTNNCNLKCIYCSDQGLRDRQGRGASFEKNKLFELFKDLKDGGTKGVTIEGGGEPSVYTDFYEIVAYAKNLGLAVGLITNGTKKIEAKILKEFEWIRVSLDASTQEEYYKLKRVDLFEKVMTNIFQYTQHCNTVGVGYVVTKENIGALEPLVFRLRESNVSYIQFRPVVDNAELYPKGEDLIYLTFYQTANFGVIIDGMTENSDSGNYGLPCVCHSLTTVITASGDVYLCGRMNIHDWLNPIGNLYKDGFKEIWNGKERRRQSMMVDDAVFCKKHCPQCRISKFNKLIDNLNNIKSKNFI